MITRTELFERISDGENSGVEFKRDTLQNHQLAKELVAFSNLEGGMVFLGVDDDGGIVGIKRDKLEEWVMTVCRDKIRPAIIPFFDVFKNVEPGKDVAVVQVLRGLNVHSQWHNNRDTYYIRVGSQSRTPSTEELSRLFQQRGMLRADAQPISGVTVDDLDQYRLKDYFERVRQQEIPSYDAKKDEWKIFLFNAEIMVEEGVTLSAILLFGKTPNQFLPQAGIDAFAFPGNQKDYATRERALLRGPMTPLFNEAGDMLLETGLVEQALDFVKRNTNVIAFLEDGARRVESRTYPDEVIREAVVNALVHRDYLLGNTNIELSIYENRLEIISPGKLPNGITPDRMRVGARSPRNILLMNVMRDYRYVDHMGMGVPRKIVQGMKEHNGTEPELIEEDERFIIRLFAGKEEG